MISAKVIADSISPRGHRLTTLEVTMHRFVLAEFNTHRVFSRNSASSRAIPVSKTIEQVETNPAYPLVWPSEQAGMQGGEEISKRDQETAKLLWSLAIDSAVRNAKFLHSIKVHKSVINRILEPFMWHTVIVTATEWDNFWGLRCNELAQPEIRRAAEEMQLAYNSSIPKELGYGQWHLPYIENEDWAAGSKLVELGRDITPLMKKVSSARCARVSYLTHDGKRDIEKDLQLYERLASARPMHASPFEHVARPLTFDEEFSGYPRPRGNFKGWYQFRQEVEDNMEITK